ncbi:MAG: CRISPR-associated endonuclease Cas3'', partial [Desulfobacteraceae bacterium]|nr:CRISPR-associated endonuclease Cas3'' [Desulfobacteraceae bacterium]
MGVSRGLLHDAGKATDDFTRRLEGKPLKVDHSSFGARLAQERAGRLGLLLSYAIAGHHGGLPDGGEQETELHFRLKNGRAPADVQLLPEVDFREELVPPFRRAPGTAGFSLAFF